jgi:putative FmdB family regulatory protein
MPTYEYVCKACDTEFEREQRISDPPVKTCPSCKAKQVKRLISRTSFHLKGGGWYSDLYSKPKGGGKSDGEAKSEPAPSSGGGGESKSESKPEKKADKKPAKSGASSGGSGSGGGSGSKAAA